MKFKIQLATNGQYYFTLHARNGKVIATSETYLTKQALRKGIRSVRLTAPFAKVEDLTK